MPSPSRNLSDFTSKSMGQRILIEAKMKEFEGLLFIGASSAADRIREEARTLLDCYFDGQVEFVAAVRRGDFSG